MRTLLLILLIPFLSSCNGSDLKTDKLYVGYDYGNISFKINPVNGEQIPVITTLFDNGYFEFTDEVEMPALEYDFLVPGDYLSITYEGDLLCQESYPSKLMISGERLISAEYIYTNIIEIESENISRNEDGTVSEISSCGHADEYVILDKDLNYVPLDEYDGEKLFASVDYSQIQSCPVGAWCAPSCSYLFGALFAFNPRI
ncbi:MAG TPA: hypothetical protein PKC96_05995 [Bacilli bacterium]|nr:hypothetical protein [Bacilli bacterium]